MRGGDRGSRWLWSKLLGCCIVVCATANAKMACSRMRSRISFKLHVQRSMRENVRLSRRNPPCIERVLRNELSLGTRDARQVVDNPGPVMTPRRQVRCAICGALSPGDFSRTCTARHCTCAIVLLHSDHQIFRWVGMTCCANTHQLPRAPIRNFGQGFNLRGRILRSSISPCAVQVRKAK